jgi:hypothetical protein
MEKKMTKTIMLPVQTFKPELIPNRDKIHKLMFQFDVDENAEGQKVFTLVAYPAYKKGSEWEIGERILLSLHKDGEVKELPLPLTLGNLELPRKDIKKWLKSKDDLTLTFTPYLYDKNAHAAYTVSDGTTTATANPIPPGNPT